MDEKRGRGRPRKSESFNHEFEFRASEKHENMVTKLIAETGKTRGEILREALEKYYYLKIMGEMTYFD